YTGFCHFVSGVTHVRQMTGREHCDIQRSIVAVIAGCAPPTFVCVICSPINSIYQAQAPIHTTTSLQSLSFLLAAFHHKKDAILQSGAWKGKKGPIKHFWIPKLELMQSFV
ncbi:hypothetical protein SERLA73DRAFT_47114, partial [Serpula lacrymans var. lacrymans S7.3]